MASQPGARRLCVDRVPVLGGRPALPDRQRCPHLGAADAREQRCPDSLLGVVVAGRHDLVRVREPDVVLRVP
eukprot:896256-Rhodomonas_salina.1